MKTKSYPIPITLKSSLTLKSSIYLLGNILVAILIYFLPWEFLPLPILLGTLTVILPLAYFLATGFIQNKKRLNKLTYKTVKLSAEGLHFVGAKESINILWEDIHSLSRHWRQRAIIFNGSGGEVYRVDCALNDCTGFLETVVQHIYSKPISRNQFSIKWGSYFFAILFFIAIAVFGFITIWLVGDVEFFVVTIGLLVALVWSIAQTPHRIIFEKETLKVQYFFQTKLIDYQKIHAVRLNVLQPSEVNHSRYRAYYPIDIRFEANDKKYHLSNFEGMFLLYSRLKKASLYAISLYTTKITYSK